MGKPDIVVTMPTPYVLKATGGGEYYDVEVDPGFKEDVYVSAVETKPDQGFAVIHRCTTNLVEDPAEDPVGLVLNEYAVGKNADIFPTNSWATPCQLRARLRRWESKASNSAAMSKSICTFRVGRTS
jgi:hypothetical protein